jgi:hypothetical protein
VSGRSFKRLSPVRVRHGMAVATVNLRVQPYRLLTKSEAAHYCRRPVRKFEAQCPVRPIRMVDGDLLWDVADLDRWIDSLKVDEHASADALIARLK